MSNAKKLTNEQEVEFTAWFNINNYKKQITEHDEWFYEINRRCLIQSAINDNKIEEAWSLFNALFPEIDLQNKTSNKKEISAASLSTVADVLETAKELIEKPEINSWFNKITKLDVVAKTKAFADKFRKVNPSIGESKEDNYNNHTKLVSAEQISESLKDETYQYLKLPKGVELLDTPAAHERKKFTSEGVIQDRLITINLNHPTKKILETIQAVINAEKKKCGIPQNKLENQFYTWSSNRVLPLFDIWAWKKLTGYKMPPAYYQTFIWSEKYLEDIGKGLTNAYVNKCLKTKDRAISWKTVKRLRA